MFYIIRSSDKQGSDMRGSTVHEGRALRRFNNLPRAQPRGLLHIL